MVAQGAGDLLHRFEFASHDAMAEKMQEEDRATRSLMRAGAELDEIWVETAEKIGMECNEEAEAESGVESWSAEMAV